MAFPSPGPYSSPGSHQNCLHYPDALVTGDRERQPVAGELAEENEMATFTQNTVPLLPVQMPLQWIFVYYHRGDFKRLLLIDADPQGELLSQVSLAGAASSFWKWMMMISHHSCSAETERA